jgi:serine/threonine protein phosphatase PrpC
VSARKRTLPYAGGTDVGLIRSGNEDSYLMNAPLFAVADGLGGHQAGEVASRIAVETLFGEAPKRADAKALARAARIANTAVIEAAQTGRGRTGMGTTLTAAMVYGTRIVIAHVGDSRAYVLHLGTLTQVTEDHSMVADMVRAGTLSLEASRVHPNRSVITRALGSDPNLLVDAFEVEAAPGDRLLLCSDGLTAMVPDEEIERLLGTAHTPQDAVTALISAANDGGGQDNITAVVVDIDGRPATGAQGEATAPARRADARRWIARIAWVFAAAAIVTGAVYAAYSYAHSQAYVIEENGVVVVYEGVPGEFVGVTLHWLASVTDIPTAALDPITATRLKDGIRVDGLAPAFGLIAEYRLQVEPSLGTSTPVDPSTTP